MIREKLAHLEHGLHEVQRKLTQVEETQQEERAARGNKVIEWAKVALPLLVSGLAGFFTLHNRVSYIEATRFTNIDFEREMAKIRSEMSNGPDWLRTILSKMEARQELTLGDLEKIRERLSRIENQTHK